MKYYFLSLVVILVIQKSVAPPVTQEKEKEKENEVDVNDPALSLEYGRYLKEVVDYLEKDEQFNKRLNSSNQDEIRSGKIADYLVEVSPDVRTKLDELKRAEIKRLTDLASEKEKREHLDYNNVHRFEKDDLIKLIAKVTKDLEEADNLRRKEFKEYEMQKKLEEEKKMNNMTEEEKNKFKHEIEDRNKKQKDHERLHYPGNKPQLEEVWKDSDHMENEFNPEQFFYMHDLNGDKFLDENEIKTLHLVNLHKLNIKDPREKAEALELMKEEFLKNIDFNRDRLISWDEFDMHTNKKYFNQDPDWEPLIDQNSFSDSDFEAYKQAHFNEMYPPHHDPNVQQPMQYQHVPQQQQQQQQQYHQPGQYHPGQDGYHQQVNPQQAQYGHVPYQQQQQQHHPNDIPQHQQQVYHPNDVQYMSPHDNLNPAQHLPEGHLPQQQPNPIPQKNQFHQSPEVAHQQEPLQPNIHQQNQQQFQQQQQVVQQQHQQQFQQQQQVVQQQPPVAQQQFQQQIPVVQQQQNQQQFQQQPVQQQQPPVIGNDVHHNQPSSIPISH